MDIIQGEQFTRYIGGTNIGYSQCDQIVLVCYECSTKAIAFTFVKVADPLYPGAALLEPSDDPDYELKIFVTEAMTENLRPGTYKMEAKRVISGVKQPIAKGREAFMTVSKTLIP
jgi:hypothetical protein